MFRFLKTTVFGGILFIVPIVIFVAIIGKALELTNVIAAPLAEILVVDSIGGAAIVNLLALAVLILICFLAGLVARTVVAKNFVKSLESNVLDNIPAYELLKAKTQSILSPDEAENLRPAITRFDDSWQLAFEIERLPDSKVVVYLPGAPDPWSGSVCVVTNDRVTPLDLTVYSAANWMKRIGKGSSDALQKAFCTGSASDLHKG